MDVMCNDFWKSLEKKSNKKYIITTIVFGCIFVLVFYQFTLETQSSSRSIYESFLVVNKNKAIKINNIVLEPNNVTSTITNENTINNNLQEEENIKNRSVLLFDENPMWMEKKMTSYFKNIVPLSGSSNKTKKILGWNKDFFGGLSPLGVPRGPDWFRSLGCPIWNCEVFGRGRGRENNSNLALPVDEYDAIFFYDTTWFNQSLPAKRSPHQIYVWYSCEPPGFHSYLKKWNESAGLFNLTWSYRWDSDITDPYGTFRPITGADIRAHETIGEIKDNYAEGKTKMVVWFVSNCRAKNGRQEYVHQLQRHLPVDIYGGCGNLSCSRQAEHECRTIMGRDYKFTIAFENSICLDYVTEKYFRNIRYNTIPIVMDRNGNYARMAPAKSYINALDFPTVKELAEYLKVLDKNDTLYNEYFWWKKHYVFGQGLNAACELCARLHNPSTSVPAQKNLLKWWHQDANCKVVKFAQDNNTVIVEDFDPPYDSPWPEGHQHWLYTVNQ